MIPTIDTVVIESCHPEIAAGKHPIKRVAGDVLVVEADVFTHGHEVVRACVQYRKRGEDAWRESEMEHLVNDRWRGSFRLEENAAYEYTIFAWRDPFLSWAQDLRKKHEAAQDISSDLLEGKQLVRRAIEQASGLDRDRLQELLAFFDTQLSPATGVERALELVSRMDHKVRQHEPVEPLIDELRQVLKGISAGQAGMGPAGDPVRDIILGDELQALMRIYTDRRDCGRYHRILEVVVDRPEAEYASWYEMWARSQGTIEGKSATFADMERRLDEIRWMGFNVVYLPPIHPIGHTHRKGPNNSLVCPPGSPGCPYAIGNELGGHTAIDPDLGTIDDFRRFERKCRSMGMELALDVALQTSPDHPWVKEHPEWFKHRPDGSIKFAENPPKKYEDIYPLNFNTSDQEGLWRDKNLVKQIEKEEENLENHGEVDLSQETLDLIEKFTKQDIKRLETAHQEVEEIKKQHKRSKNQEIQNKPIRVSLTDPYSRFMKNKKGRKELSYNIQNVVDCESGIILKTTLTQDPTDHYQLIPQLENISQIPDINTEEAKILADNAYNTQYGVEYAYQNEFDLYTPNRVQASENKKQTKKDKNMFSKANFNFNPEKNQYICPNKHELPYKNTYNKNNTIKKVYYTNNCRTCPNKNKCTPNSNYRIISHYHNKYQDLMTVKMESPENKEIYKKRNNTESPFAYTKNTLKRTTLNQKTPERNQTELNLIATSNNIKRTHNHQLKKKPIQKDNKIKSSKKTLHPKLYRKKTMT